MIRNIKRLTSFRNLLNAGNKKGQIATLLIMLTVVLLIFVMVTMNLGETSLMSTRIANAADAATLSLASQLSTKSRQLSDGLINSGASDTSPTKACSNTGLAAIVCAIVLVIFAILILICTWGAGAPASAKLFILAVSIVAGAAGGAAGGAYAGTGAWQGAMQGAIVGASIATIYIGAGCPGMTQGAGANTLTGFGASEGFGSAGELGSLSGSGGAGAGAGEGLTGFGASEGFGSAGELGSLAGGGATGAAGVEGAAAVEGAGGATTMSSFGAAMGYTTAPIIPTSVVSGGAMFQGALSLASTGYNQSVQDKIVKKQIDLFVKMMGNANEKDRMRESAFMTALSQIVDDPNMSADTADTNLNKNEKELVSNFQIWVFHRLDLLGTLANEAVRPINGFFDATRTFQDQFATWINGYDYWEETKNGTTYSHLPGGLEKEDFKIIADPDGSNEQIVANAGNDGYVAKLLRGLESAGYDLSFFEPGPTVAALQAAGASCSETSCVTPEGFDQLDAMVEDLREIRSWLYNLDVANPARFTHTSTDINGVETSYIDEKSRMQAERERAQTWGEWFDVFYDPQDTPENPVSFYFILKKYVGVIDEWRDEVLAVIRTLPDCVSDPKDNTQELFYPCKNIDGNIDSCTVTKDKVNDYANFDDYLYERQNSFDALNGHLRSLYVALHSASPKTETGMSISDLGGLNPAVYQWDDARGHHSVKVGTGNFKVPKLESTRYGNWFKGKKCMELRDYSDNGSNCWVKVERIDPHHDMGFLGIWNPFRRGVSKIARAAYSYDYLKLVE